MRSWLVALVLLATTPAHAYRIDPGFARANHLFAQGKYLEAAAVFYERAHRPAPYDRDGPTATYNAAVCFELAGRWQTAIAVYEELVANPDEQYRRSGYRLEGMVRLARVFHQMDDHRRARDTYLAVYRSAAHATQLRITSIGEVRFERIAADALRDAASEAELANDLADAIALLADYERIETDRRKRDRAAWRIASLAARLDDVVEAEIAFAHWRTTYGRDAGNAADVIAGYHAIAEQMQRTGRGDRAAAADAVIAAWRRSSTRDAATTRIAAGWLLARADDKVERVFTPLAVDARSKVDKQVTTLVARMRELDVAYAELEALGVPELAAAAAVRAGELRYDLARKLVDACTPTPCAGAGLDALVGDARAAWQRAVAMRVHGLWRDRAVAALATEFPEPLGEPAVPLLAATSRP